MRMSVDARERVCLCARLGSLYACAYTPACVSSCLQLCVCMARVLVCVCVRTRARECVCRVYNVRSCVYTRACVYSTK